MSKRTHLSFRRVVPVIASSLIALSGCGGDDESPKDGGVAGKAGEAATAGSSAGKGGSSGGGAGGASGSSGRGAAGATGSGSGAEGEECMTTADCGMGLACVISAITEDTGIRVCARPCSPATEATDCGSESCESDTGRAQDAHCRNYEPAPFAICGPGATAACGGQRTCLFLPDAPIGICVDVCALDPSKDAGVDGPLLEKCPGTQTCISDIVDQAGVGICGTEVKRDEVCGIEMGKFCPASDICFPDDPTNDDSPQHCREDCTKSGMCTMGGTCTAYRNLFSYCKK